MVPRHVPNTLMPGPQVHSASRAATFYFPGPNKFCLEPKFIPRTPEGGTTTHNGSGPASPHDPGVPDDEGWIIVTMYDAGQCPDGHVPALPVLRVRAAQAMTQLDSQKQSVLCVCGLPLRRSPVLPAGDDTSYCLLLDARNIEIGPIATLKLRDALPHQIHGCFYPNYFGPDLPPSGEPQCDDEGCEVTFG